jgi:hypothetical protein
VNLRIELQKIPITGVIDHRAQLAQRVLGASLAQVARAESHASVEDPAVLQVRCVCADHERQRLLGRRDRLVETVGSSQDRAAGAGGVERELVTGAKFAQCEIGRGLDVHGSLIVVRIQVGCIGSFDEKSHAIGGWPVALVIHLRPQLLELVAQLVQPTAKAMQRQSLQASLPAV